MVADDEQRPVSNEQEMPFDAISESEFRAAHNDA